MDFLISVPGNPFWASVLKFSFFELHKGIIGLRKRSLCFVGVLLVWFCLVSFNSHCCLRCFKVELSGACLCNVLFMFRDIAISLALPIVDVGFGCIAIWALPFQCISFDQKKRNAIKLFLKENNK